MAPTPRQNHTKHEAGLLSEETAERARGRRYFQVADNLKEGTSGRTPSPFCTDTTDRKPGDGCGLSSLELTKVYDHNHRRGLKHICPHAHADFQAGVQRPPSTPSVISDIISEDSAMFHLGHREKISKAWEEAEAQEAVSTLYPMYQEDTAGLSSHFLNRKGRLGLGKKKYGSECQWANPYHQSSSRLDGFGGEQQKNVIKRQAWRADCADHIFDGQIEEKPERSHKRMYKEHYGKPHHEREDVPLGVSTQIDLDSIGFLGKSKGRVSDGTRQDVTSCDPITDKSDQPRDLSDISCYGLNQRGKRKYLVQTNLDSGCRHNMSVRDGPAKIRSASVPALGRELPPNTTPYYQDDLPQSARAVKDELPPCCRTGRECERTLKPRRHCTEPDSTWDALMWSPRKVDQLTATQFVEGPDSLHPTTDEEHRERDFRIGLGHTKRSFGNAHNKSVFRFDHGDDPGFDQEQVRETRRKDDVTKEDVSVLIRWGAGHGRRKIEPEDHFYGEARDHNCYQSNCGVKLGERLKPVPAHMDPNKKNDDQNFVLDANGLPISFKARANKVMKDTVHESMNDDVQSDHSNSYGVVGMRRKSDLIRPCSARRFPQTDFEKVTPRSLTPRGRREAARIPLSERPIWQK